MTLDIYAGLFGDDLDSIADAIDRLRDPSTGGRDDDDDGSAGVLVPAS
jgi:hypothetical protein